jgi:hypothetical protein
MIAKNVEHVAVTNGHGRSLGVTDQTQLASLWKCNEPIIH